jgi:hypothetical protein
VSRQVLRLVLFPTLLALATLLGTYDAKPADAVIAQIYTLPYQGSGYVTCGFGCYSGHEGVDYVLGANGVGHHPVLAAHRGTAKRCDFSMSAGYMAVIDHGNGHRTRYIHMEAPALPNNGQLVARGQPIGYEGNLGHTDPPGFYQLHFETRHGANTFTCNKDGTAVNPYHPSSYMWMENPPGGAMDMDWSGDGLSDVLARKPNGELCLFRGNGANSWIAGPDGPTLCGDGERIGIGWESFINLVRAGDWSGDGCHDILARKSNGEIWLYRGNCAGGFIGTSGTAIGWGWYTTVFDWLLAPGDFSGDGFMDVLARELDGDLCLVRGNGASLWIPHTEGPECGDGRKVGEGWQVFTWLVEPRDFGGTSCMDVMGDWGGTLHLYMGNCTEGWSGALNGIGSGWQDFEAMIGVGDFSGDGCPDILTRKYTGTPDFWSFRGNCAGFWHVPAGSGIGTGWWPPQGGFDKLF